MTVNNQENEFVCRTCKTNENLEGVINQVETTGAWWIPQNIRRTYGVGIIFTKDSLLYNFHFEHGTDHDWGNVAEIEAKLADIKAVEELLRNQQS